MALLFLIQGKKIELAVFFNGGCYAFNDLRLIKII